MSTTTLKFFSLVLAFSIASAAHSTRVHPTRATTQHIVGLLKPHFRKSMMIPISRPVVPLTRSKAWDLKEGIGMLESLKSDILAKNNIVDRYRNIIETGCTSKLTEKHLHDGYKILDVRPNCEVNDIYPRGSVHAEFSSSYNKDGSKSLPIPNLDFIEKVEEIGVSREDRILVACGDGPLSFIACKKLRDAGTTYSMPIQNCFHLVYSATSLSLHLHSS